MSRLPVLSFVCLIILLFDYYCFRALLSVFKRWSAPKRKLFTVLYWGYAIALIIGVFCSIYLNLFLSLRAVILVAFFLTTVSKIFMLPFLLADDIRRFWIKWFRKPAASENQEALIAEGENISRSQFIVKAGLVAAAVPLSTLTWGIVGGAYDYQIKRKTLVLPKLPKAFDGIQIAQISDIHSGSFYNQKAVLGGVEMLLQEKPDLVFFTGDLVNNKANELRDYQDIFAKVKAPLGVYSVLGNHDYGEYYYGKAASAAKTKNLNDLIKAHELMGYKLLLNTHEKIQVDGTSIGVLGVENWGMGRFPKYGKMQEAVKGTEDLPVKLLLSHDPSHWRGEILEKYKDIDVTFSGHTHGMQFGVRTENWQWSPAEYIYKEWAGLYQNNAQQLYVNVGYGFLGYPGRVGISPEITILTLKQA